jgi:zona occludens toxin (predicted ATPase)
MAFRAVWNKDNTGMTSPVSDNAAFTGAPTKSERFGPALNELQSTDQKQLTPIKPMSRGKSAWKVRLLVFAIALVFGAISASWRQIEKFAPGLNKTIHSSVTTQDDVDYHSAKLAEARKQYNKVLTQAPGQSNQDFKRQFIAQGPVALKAMEYETSELMQAIPHEHVTEECQPLINNMFKQTQEYYRVEELIFKAVSDGASQEQFKALNTLEDKTAFNRDGAIKAFHADKNCKGL